MGENTRKEHSSFKHIVVDELPNGWQAKRFSDLVKFRMGKTPPRNRDEYWDKGVYPWVSIADMQPFRTVTNTKEKVSEEAHKQVFHRNLVPTGSLLMSFKLTIGRVAKLGLPAYHNEAIISFRPDDMDIDSDFLFYHLGQLNYVNYQDTAVKGQTLNKGKLEQLEIALPPFREQQKIAAVLGTVQRAIEEQERLLRLTTELKKSLLHKLFTEGLRGEPQKQTEIGPVPESWELVPLGSLAKIGNGSTPKRDNDGYWRGGAIPWLNSTKIHDRFITEADQFVTELAVKECHLPHVQPGSLLIAITGQGKTLGNSALVSFQTCINQHLAYAQFITSSVLSEFVLWFMQTRYDHLRSISQAGGSTKGALTCGYLKTYLVPVPALDEQHEIANVFTAMDLKEKTQQHKHTALTDLFRTLLHQLMTAEIRANKVDIRVLNNPKGG